MVKTIDAMESDRPHHPIRTVSRNSNPNPTNTTTTSELFVCFTSRLSSSSSSTMKISKSILSPGRSGRDPPSQISLSSSLSRRLRANNSLKGGQSPMFPTTGKKKGGAGFENPEPSSPKVTCIGQVRVKSRKNKAGSKKISRSRSQRRSGEYSFRRIESSTAFRNRDIELDKNSQRHGHNSNSNNNNNNQKWVHIPVTICETLRSLGSDFNCFLPCTRSSCVSNRAHKPGDAVNPKGDGCGSVLARWLVAAEDDGEKGRGRQIELVVGGDDGDETDDRDDSELFGRRSYRKRHVMEDIDVREIERELRDKVAGLGEFADRRVSVCAPPKNALLLMRCRSDPVKVAALANKFFDPPVPVLDDDVEEEKEVCEVGNLVENGDKIEEVLKECETEQKAMEVMVTGAEQDSEDAMEVMVPEAEEFEVKLEDESLCDKFVTEEMYEDVVEDAPRFSVHMVEAGNAEADEECPQSDLEMEDLDGLESSSSPEDQLHVEEFEREQDTGEVDMVEISCENVAVEDHRVTSPSSELDEVVISSHENEDEAEFECEEERRQSSESEDSESGTEEEEQVEEEEERSSALPDCLLLMMCEPKLSMEVSKETWVCTTDFIRWLPPREVKKKKDSSGGGDELSKRVSVHYKPPPAPYKQPQKAVTADNAQFLPPRSSCSYPAPPPKLKSANSAACDPFSLKRCKSEPGRNAAKFGPAPGACFWKKEPHHRGGAPVGVGVGAAGVGIGF